MQPTRKPTALPLLQYSISTTADADILCHNRDPEGVSGNWAALLARQVPQCGPEYIHRHANSLTNPRRNVPTAADEKLDQSSLPRRSVTSYSGTRCRQRLRTTGILTFSLCVECQALNQRRQILYFQDECNSIPVLSALSSIMPLMRALRPPCAHYSVDLWLQVRSHLPQQR